MNIILYSINFSPELAGIGKYNGEMIQWFAKRKHNISVITAPPYYPEWKVHKGFRKYWFKSEKLNGIRIIRCPLYIPNVLSTLKRIVHLLSFAFSSSFALFSLFFKRPDVVILVQPTFFCVPITLLFCKLTGAKSVMHVQDYEIDAMFGLGMMKKGKITQLATLLEAFLLKRFDMVSTISYSMMENAKAKGVEASKVIFFPNWADTDFVNPETDGTNFRKRWGFDPKDKLILYSGNIGKKQGLDIIFTAAQHYRKQENIKFIIVGSGSFSDELKKMAAEQGLENVTFKPLQAWDDVPQMLAMADIHLVIQKRGAADVVLPSKLTNILSVGGHALVTAGEETELGKMAKRHEGIFETVEPESPLAFLAGLKKILSLDMAQYNEVAREYAEKNLGKKEILVRFENELNNLLERAS